MHSSMMRTPASVAVSAGGVCLWVQGGVCLWVLLGGLPVGAGGVSACGSGGDSLWVWGCVCLWVQGDLSLGLGGVCLWVRGCLPLGLWDVYHTPWTYTPRHSVQEGCMPLGPGGVSASGSGRGVYLWVSGHIPPDTGSRRVSASGSGRGVCLWVRGGVCLWVWDVFTTTPGHRPLDTDPLHHNPPFIL